MPVSRTILSALLLGLLAGPCFKASGLAAERPHGGCLDRAEQRAAVASHRAIPLALAIRSLPPQGHRSEVVRAELCQRGDRLVYVLTLLPRSGKVTRAVIDASSGNPLGGG
jgi:hypothetical protein